MKQFITKKNSTPTGIDNRDMKSGLLVSFDKGGKTSDRETAERECRFSCGYPEHAIRFQVEGTDHCVFAERF